MFQKLFLSLLSFKYLPNLCDAIQLNRGELCFFCRTFKTEENWTSFNVLELVSTNLFIIVTNNFNLVHKIRFTLVKKRKLVPDALYRAHMASFYEKTKTKILFKTPEVSNQEDIQQSGSCYVSKLINPWQIKCHFICWTKNKLFEF